mmetsp:Transcript_21743/g.53728  ORF Transcript_21743/g.53728 Transcript_21743/m.53728 type:complete len:333 (-) Transcript_21743:58-1056(-)
MRRRATMMLESLITIQAILSNVNGAAIPRSLSASVRSVTIWTNIVISTDGYNDSPPRPPVIMTGRFPQPYSAGPPLNLQRSQRRNYLTSLGWTQRMPLTSTSRSYSTYLSSSSTVLFATPRGGDTHNNDSSKLNLHTSEQQDIELPFRKYGYRSAPFSWEELDQIIVKEKNLAKLSRSVVQEQDYQRALAKLRQEWKSTKDYILHSKFNLPKQLDKETQLYFVDETSANQQGQGVLRKLVPNDFPYYCAPGIEHWVLWKYGANSAISREDIDWAEGYLLHQPSSTNGVVDPNMISWENPPDMKSLPEINHVHILLRHNPNANPKLRRKGWLE